MERPAQKGADEGCILQKWTSNVIDNYWTNSTPTHVHASALCKCTLYSYSSLFKCLMCLAHWAPASCSTVKMPWTNHWIITPSLVWALNCLFLPYDCLDQWYTIHSYSNESCPVSWVCVLVYALVVCCVQTQIHTVSLASYVLCTQLQAQKWEGKESKMLHSLSVCLCTAAYVFMHFCIHVGCW